MPIFNTPINDKNLPQVSTHKKDFFGQEQNKLFEQPISNSRKFPLITLITPSYNQGQYLEATIKSVTKQSYPKLEYIIIDGGSIDDSVEIIKKYQSSLTYWVSEKDNGQSNALNKGFARATGDIMGWLNSDDLLAEGALHYLAQAYQSGLHWWTGGVSRILLDGSFIAYNPQKVKSVSYQEILHARIIVDQVSTFWTRELWQETGGYIKNLHLAMDYELWLRFAKITPSTPIHQTLGIFRNHQDAKTGTTDNYLLYLEECDQVRKTIYDKIGYNPWLKNLLIAYWTRSASARRSDWKSWIGRRPMPYV